jgi:nucleotide-binding universal stress UspA family protein
MEEVAVTSTPEQSGHRIVVGTDGSASSVEALEWGAHQAELTGFTLEAIMTWEWPTSYGVPYFLPPDYDPEADARRALEETLAPIRVAHPAVDISAEVIEGHPAPVLLAASEGAELLIVGSRGHGEFAGMLLGSVSEHLVANSHCPVVVLRGGGDKG